ncbi:putative alpha-mannosidase [Diplonema papillatum]|nr:putative alpha-mannosidase [Diplonema papillatum]
MDPHSKYVNGDVFMARFKYNKTEASMPLWKDKEPRLRGPPPYTPPRDWVYNTKAGPRDGMINVHLVPHSHDDTGWQVTVDQYFYTEVYYILDTLLEFLTQDPNRRFMFVETAFFARWWDQQPATKKEQFSRLVQTGQLEFVNGGWCMHDEAGPYWVEMVDQTTRGHQFLKKNFGAAAYPKGTWQIDPFGHSNTNAWLIAAGSGMNYEFWGRMSYQDFAMRKNESRLEWIWQGSQTLGSSAQIFAGELFGGGGGGYGTFIEFDGTGDQVQDDPRRHDYNIDYWVDMIVTNAQAQAQSTRTDHQMWACGSDFNYQNADHWYHNLDKIIHYANLNGTVNAFYSTPTFYVEQKQKAGLTWEVRQDDIFPLGDADHHYWSGYFTSRPALKRQVHVASNFLNAARQMEVVSGVSKSEIQNPTTRPSPVVGKSWTDSLEGTIGVATHHDGMSGTERQDVADDYALRISESHGEVEEGVALSLNRLLNINATLEHCNCNAVGADNCLNITVCPTTTGAQSFDVVAWNSLGRNSSQYLRIPVSFSSATVTGPMGAVTNVQVDAIDARTLSIPLLYLNKFNMTSQQIAAAEQQIMNNATHVVSFMAELPPMGYGVYTVAAASKPAVRRIAAAANMIENEYYSLSFDMTSGRPSMLTNKRTNTSTTLSVEFGWYNSSVGGCTAGVEADHACDSQKSGAYIFRPNTSTLFPPGPASVAPKLTFNQGQYVQEVYQNFSNWATLVYRLTAGSKFIDVEWTAGPIPMDTPWIPAVAPEHAEHVG